MAKRPNKAPFADEHSIYSEIAKEAHIMIGGATGSGKSVVEKGIIYNLVNNYTPDEVQLYFIDPKKVVLHRLALLPHVSGYADTDESAMDILNYLRITMDQRNRWCQENDCENYPGSAIYCFIDETADVIVRRGKEALRNFQLLLQMARSANIHMVFCSQCVNRKLIPAEVQCNITCVVGLKCRKSIESRQLVDSDACMKLPRYGKCVMITPDGEEVRDVPMYEDIRFELMKDFWAGMSVKNLTA